MMNKGERVPHVVIAAAKDDARFKAVEVRKQDNVIEVLWTKSLPADGQTWTAFAATCGIPAPRDGHERATRRHTAAVVGLDSTGVAFYRVAAPAVEQQEIGPIVRMQAESLLPLPPDQIEVAWRTMPGTNGNVDITIAAARREYLKKFAGSVRDFGPGQILLSCEGTTKAWQSLFSDRDRDAVLVSITAENTQVCLVQKGLVAQAAVLGTGLGEFQERGSDETDATNPQVAIMSPPAPTGGHRPQSLEWFAQDLKATLTGFGWNECSPWPVLVLSDGGEVLNRVVEALAAAGVPAKVSMPEVRNLRLPSGGTPQDIYDYRTALGLSLLALERPPAALNLFERIAAQEEQEKLTSAWRSVLVASVVAAVALVALLVTVYLTDIAGARRWADLVARPDFEAARQHQALLKAVARYRPEVLYLLTCINAGKNDGILLDGLHFKKGQTVMIVGQAGTTEQMWTFEKNLRAQKDISGVTIVNPTQDNKTKKVKFTITFNYKIFSKKEAVL
jgi:hypothetical protein